MLWQCWLGGRKGIRPVKTEWWGTGVVICLERGADCHSLSLASVKSRLVLPFWYRLTQVVLDKGLLNGVCVFGYNNGQMSNFESELNWRQCNNDRLIFAIQVCADTITGLVSSCCSMARYECVSIDGQLLTAATVRVALDGRVLGMAGSQRRGNASRSL